MGIMGKKPLFFPWYLPLFSLFLKIHFSGGSDTIYEGQSLSGNQTLSSKGGIFELGFFTPSKSQNYYIGIWYKNLPTEKTVVWVANREQPVSNPVSSKLKLSEDGKLILLNETGNTIWSSSYWGTNIVNSTKAKLLDDGNFVVTGMSRLRLPSLFVAWQSFDHPTDHWLPGGKVWDYRRLVSWRSFENPAPSLFSFDGKTLSWNGSISYSWDWERDTVHSLPELTSYRNVTNFSFVYNNTNYNKSDTYFTYDSAIPNALARYKLDISGQLKLFIWRRGSREWVLIGTRPSQQCDVLAVCGAFSVCNEHKQDKCVCLDGFEPEMRKQWELGDHTTGCVRKVPLQCDNKEAYKFVTMPNATFEFMYIWNLRTIEECEFECLNVCSCVAFSFVKNLCRGGDSYRVIQNNGSYGHGLHVKIAATRRSSSKRKSIISATIAGSFAVVAVLLVIYHRRCHSSGSFEGVEDNSLILFKYRDLRNVTANFSKKLGEGGFGAVFKGTLPNSTSVAVKKLKNLKQCEKQFLAEVKTIGIIQHVNLIHLRGFCVEGSQRFLVYEYMPSGSLESHLFQKSGKILDWRSRYKIAIGTAKGLAYLHEDCRDCIIHCDIKPENILLDEEYNPIVADFGLAKLLGRDFSKVLTTMRGTLGYLAPEWFSGESITHKTDVFSYGMMLLEIISGRRNRDITKNGFKDYFPLLAATTVHNGENVHELLDYRLEGNAIIDELVRACKVACCCIQDDEKDRLTMKEVVLILEGVSEVSIPPIPRFLQRFAESSYEANLHSETTSCSSDSRGYA